MDQELRRKIELALGKSWSKETSVGYEPENPSSNQCAQTAIVIRERFGGVIRKTIVDGYIEHWYNVIDGEIVDFTADQFNGRCEVDYDKSTPSNVEEAMEGCKPAYQVAALRFAFDSAFAVVRREA